MADQTKWYGLSLLIHLAFGCGLICLTIAGTKPSLPITIDFTIEASNNAPAFHPVPPATVRVASRKPVVHTESIIRNKTRPAPIPVPDTAAETASVIKPKSPDTAISASAVTNRQTVPDAKVTAVEDVKGHKTGSATGESRSAEQVKTIYLREHFTYIRSIVMRRLIYPAYARQMGWSGKVVLSFIVAENGTVNDVKVLQGSGFSMLDREAVNAVKRAAPFPQPPVQAEIVLPVSYRLL